MECSFFNFFFEGLFSSSIFYILLVSVRLVLCLFNFCCGLFDAIVLMRSSGSDSDGEVEIVESSQAKSAKRKNAVQ